jgi:hypothetical protein
MFKVWAANNRIISFGRHQISRTTSPLICVLSFTILSCSPAIGQDPASPFPLLPENAKSGKLGSYMEGLFQRQLGVCLTGSPSPKKLAVTKPSLLGTTSKDLSAIPPALADPTVKPNGTVIIGFDSSIGRTFAYIYPAKSIVLPSVDVTNYVIADYLEDPQRLTKTGLDNAVYDFGCSASIAASMKLNSKWSFPPADVSTALQADLSSKSTYHLAFVSGLFFSPLWQQYMSTTDSDWRTYGRMLLWEWYSRHPQAASDNVPRYILTQFNGVSVYKLFTSSFSNDGKADLSVALGAAAVNLSGTLQASYDQSSRSKVESFGMVVRQLGGSAAEDDAFEALPSVSELANKISSTGKAHLDSSSTDHRLFQTTAHTQIIYGIPEVICKGSWSINPATTQDGSLTVLDSSTFNDPKDSKTPPYCKIQISYHLDSPPTGTSRADLVYVLQTDLKDGNGNAIASAKFKADTVSLSASGKPSIDPASSTGMPDPPVTLTTGGVTFFTYGWNLKYPVEEDTIQQDKISSVASTVLEPKVTCTGRTDMTPFSARASFVGGQLMIALEHKNNDTIENIDLTRFSQACTFSGRVIFSLNNSMQVTADVPATQIFYSPLRPATPTGPAANQQPSTPH